MGSSPSKKGVDVQLLRSLSTRRAVTQRLITTTPKQHRRPVQQEALFN